MKSTSTNTYATTIFLRLDGLSTTTCTQFTLDIDDIFAPNKINIM